MNTYPVVIDVPREVMVSGEMLERWLNETILGLERDGDKILSHAYTTVGGGEEKPTLVVSFIIELGVD